MTQKEKLTKSPDSEYIAWEGEKTHLEKNKEMYLWKKQHILWRKTRGGESTHWVWDVANSMYPDFPRNRKGVDPVERYSVLVSQKVSTIYCHL